MPNHDLSEVTHELFIHHASWCPKIQVMKISSWGLDAVKLKNKQKLIILPWLHSPPYLFWWKIGNQSHSAKFLNWGDHVNSVPDLIASPPGLVHFSFSDLNRAIYVVLKMHCGPAYFMFVYIIRSVFLIFSQNVLYKKKSKDINFRFRSVFLSCK